MEELPALSPPATLEPISRPGSASTTASQKESLPGISAIAAAAAAAAKAITRSPQMSQSSTSAPSTMSQQYSIPASAPAAIGGNNLPTCMNCQTSTTPLWRRDEAGQVLCNACGLFLKLHGRPRPISLKTDVIKSRNRVKTMRPGMEAKKKNHSAAAGANVADIHAQTAAAAALNAAVRQKGNGHIDDTNSPVSRTGTPHMYGDHMMYHGMNDHHMQQPMGDFVDPNGNAHSPLNGDAMAQTPNQLLAINSGLKTRVDELEVINDLIQRRLQHYETYGTGGNNEENMVAAANYRAQIESLQQSQAQLQSQLEESHRRENAMKRRLDEMELEIAAFQGQAQGQSQSQGEDIEDQGRAKRPRLEQEEPDFNGEAETDAEPKQEVQDVPPEPVPETLVQPGLEEVSAENSTEHSAELAAAEPQAEAPMMEAEALKEALA